MKIWRSNTVLCLLTTLVHCKEQILGANSSQGTNYGEAQAKQKMTASVFINKILAGTARGYRRTDSKCRSFNNFKTFSQYPITSSCSQIAVIFQLAASHHLLSGA